MSHETPSIHQSTQTSPTPSLPSVTSNSTSLSLFDLFIQDFETQFHQLTDECKELLKREKLRLWARFALDFLFCYIIICPLDVLFWRGTWEYSKIILKELIFGDECVYTNIACLFISIIGSMALHFSEDAIRSAAGNPGTLWHKSLTRVFNLGSGIIEIYMYKGVWDGIDCYTHAESVWAASVLLAIGISTLALCGCVRSVLSVPMGIVVDIDGNLCHLAPYFDHQDDETVFSKSKNVVTSTIFEILVICVWHGIWTLIDIGFHTVHMSHGESAPICFAVGFIGGLLIFIAQFPLLKVFASSRVPDLVKRLLNLIFCTVGVFFAVNSFRGTWYLIDEFYLVESYEQSLTNGWMIAAAMLLVLSASSSLQPGITLDPPNPRDGSLISYHYLTYFYVQETESNLEAMRKPVWRNPPPILEKEFQDIEKAGKMITTYL